jgi:hypothetical protein
VARSVPFFAASGLPQIFSARRHPHEVDALEDAVLLRSRDVEAQDDELLGVLDPGRGRVGVRRVLDPLGQALGVVELELVADHVEEVVVVLVRLGDDRDPGRHGSVLPPRWLSTRPLYQGKALDPFALLVGLYTS